MEANHQENPVNKDAQIAKRFIASLKDNLERSKSSLKHILDATKAYPQKLNRNRMIVGGIGEKVIAETMIKNGFDCENEGQHSFPTDLSVKEIISGEEYTTKISIKCSSSKSGIIIKNYYGKKQNKIEIYPTFLVQIGKDKEKEISIVYFDSEVIKNCYRGLTNDQINNFLFSNKDSNLTLKRASLNKLIKLLPDEYIFRIRYADDCLDEVEEIDIIKLAYEEMKKI